jgi:sigma-E factor negative regulatory protein RseA
MKDEAMNDPGSDERSAALSQAMDGDAGAIDAALRSYAADPSARADWHAYHLIGDVLRSSDSASTAARDAGFVARLRARLADEPVPLAPRALQRPVARQRWMAGAAVAAGFAAVAGVLVATRGSAPEAGPTLAGASAPAGPIGVDVVLVRNPDLDRYLAAHRQYAPVSTLAAPGGFVRSADVAAAPGR